MMTGENPIPGTTCHYEFDHIRDCRTGVYSVSKLYKV
jgi:hypothetical protein